MNKVLTYFKKIQSDKLLIKKIKVYGWQKEYDYLFTSSISKYLFEDLNIISNLAPITNENRPGNKKTKYYITVHDTGDTDIRHNALFWSSVVKSEAWEQGKYKCSYQYVVGNDGVYQNIPDDEVAWHAGDSTIYDYTLYDTNIKGSNNEPIITISNDGYYEIDNNKTIAKAPSIDNCFNDQGILCKLIDGKYYIGETYLSSYNKICNRGGNNNSIGIESCVNESSDIALTFQRVAKLVAYLLNKYNLNVEDVKQHHYFSGKDCPETLRRNNLWDYFIELVKVEKDIISFLEEGYKIYLEVNDYHISNNGRVKLDDKEVKASYKIKTIKDGIEESLSFEVNIPRGN